MKILIAFILAALIGGFVANTAISHGQVSDAAATTIEQILAQRGIKTDPPVKASLPYSAAWGDFFGNAVVTPTGKSMTMITFSGKWVEQQLYIEIPSDQMAKLVLF